MKIPRNAYERNGFIASFRVDLLLDRNEAGNSYDFLGYDVTCTNCGTESTDEMDDPRQWIAAHLRECLDPAGARVASTEAERL